MQTDKTLIPLVQKAQSPGAGKLALLGIFLALILAIGLFERMVPLDFAIPGVRLGLSNVIILLSIYLFRFRDTLILVTLKCALLAALAGGAPSFLYSLCGSLLSFFVMWLLIAGLKERISPIGASVAGAVCHIAGQLLVAALAIENIRIFLFMPLLVFMGAASGVLVGILVKLSLKTLARL
ncbi:MAG: Gx transporter family protein [Clostridiales Family XIII bacterium]|nr:Gx transporter family protein [Clostridiales Family XIII bacterium]